MKKVNIKKKIIFIIVMSNLFFANGCSSSGQQTYSDYILNYQEEDEFTKVFFENVSIEVEKVQTDLGRGTVIVKIPDLAGIYETHYDEFVSGQTEEEIQEIILQNINEYDMEISIDTDLVKDGKTWKVKSIEQVDKVISDMVDNFLNAVLSDMQINISIELDLGGIQ